MRATLRAALRGPLLAWLKPMVWRVRQLGQGKYSMFAEERVISRLLESVDAPRFCVDIAAGDGRTMSNTLALFEKGWSGLSVEMDGKHFRALAARQAGFRHSRLFRGRVTPGNVLDVLRAAEVPADFGFLNLDIDGYDYFVLAAILTEFRPALVCAEINEMVPPPLRFSVDYTPSHVWDGSHFFGQSLSQLELLCGRHTYSIVKVEYNNAFLMPAAIAPVSLSAVEAYRGGYADRPDRRQKFPFNEDMEPLQHLTPDAAVAFLNSAFSRYRGRYTLDAGVAGEPE
ncbi:MAG: hypothetical protein NVSMB29_16780 [Candidatus Dormibacteria bacterium]